MSYKYEMHCHTGKVSLCADIEPKKLVKTYTDAGYDGIVLTDHYSPMTFWNRHLFSPQKAMDFYLSAYHELKEYVGNDFTVLLGIELRHYATVNDYLIYGVTEEWLRAQGNMLTWDEKTVYENAHKEGYLVFQAHPYRPFIRRCDPAYLDGIEIYNGHTTPEENDRAGAWARQTGKLIISGGDTHSEKDTAKGGILTERSVRTNADLLDVLRKQDFIPIKTEKI